MGLAAFILYIFVMFALIKWFEYQAAKKRVSAPESFFINGRASSAWMVGFSIVASCVGASATIGTVGLAFEVGAPAFWWLGSGAVGLSFLTIFLAKRVRKSRAVTLPELVRDFLGPRAGYLISIIIVIAWVSILAAQLTAAGLIIKALIGSGHLTALLIGAFLIGAHTISGGQASIIKLDRFQLLAIVAGLAITAGWLASYNPPALSAIKIEAINSQFPLSRLIYFLAILGGGYVVCPMLFGRLLSAENEKAAQNGALGAVIGLIIISVIIVLIGLLARGLIPPATAADSVLTTVLENIFPAWLAIVIYLVLLSAVVSSADSCLITAALILAHDILNRKTVAYSRLCIVLLSITGLLLTFTQKSILGFLLMANDVYVCGVVGPVFIALICAQSKKAHSPLALLGISAGGGLGLLSSISGQTYLSYAGIISSALLTVISLRPKRD